MEREEATQEMDFSISLGMKRFSLMNLIRKKRRNFSRWWNNLLSVKFTRIPFFFPTLCKMRFLLACLRMSKPIYWILTQALQIKKRENTWVQIFPIKVRLSGGDKLLYKETYNSRVWLLPFRQRKESDFIVYETRKL